MADALFGLQFTISAWTKISLRALTANFGLMTVLRVCIVYQSYYQAMAYIYIWCISSWIRKLERIKGWRQRALIQNFPPFSFLPQFPRACTGWLCLFEHCVKSDLSLLHEKLTQQAIILIQLKFPALISTKILMSYVRNRQQNCLLTAESENRGTCFYVQFNSCENLKTRVLMRYYEESISNMYLFFSERLRSKTYRKFLGKEIAKHGNFFKHCRNVASKLVNVVRGKNGNREWERWVTESSGGDE